MAATAFISYATPDQAVADAIVGWLEARDVTCWIAPRDVGPGADYGAEIIDGIESSAVLVLVLSPHANASVFVKREVERAVAKHKPVFPLRIADVLPSRSLELFISSTEWIDAWPPPIEPALERLGEAIASALMAHPAAVTATPSALPDRARSAPGPAPVRPPVDHGHASAHRWRWAVVALALVVLVLGVLLFVRSPGPAPTSQSAGPAAASTAASTAPPPTVARGLPASSGPVDACPRTLPYDHDDDRPLRCRCSAAATLEGTVWGTDAYTADSSLCRAARHAGVVPAEGGTIGVRRDVGRELYVGTTRHGVRSGDFPAFPRQLVFEGSAPPPPGPGLCPQALSINRQLETPYTCRCSAAATREGTVWGTDVYTDDSALCRAARHAGRIPPEGGEVTVLRREGQASYVGSTRNGIASSDMSSFPVSIGFR